MSCIIITVLFKNSRLWLSTFQGSGTFLDTLVTPKAILYGFLVYWMVWTEGYWKGLRNCVPLTFSFYPVSQNESQKLNSSPMQVSETKVSLLPKKPSSLETSFSLFYLFLQILFQRNPTSCLGGRNATQKGQEASRGIGFSGFPLSLLPLDHALWANAFFTANSHWNWT